MQQVGSVHDGARRAYAGRANVDGTIGNNQTERAVGASTKSESVRTIKSKVNPQRGGGSGRLKDALLMSFINWFSEHLKTEVGTEEASISSDRKSVSGMSLKIIAATAAEPDISLRAQANVTEDTALHLLSAGAIAETIPEQGQKHQSPFGADDVGSRERARISQMPF